MRTVKIKIDIPIMTEEEYHDLDDYTRREFGKTLEDKLEDVVDNWLEKAKATVEVEKKFKKSA